MESATKLKNHSPHKTPNSTNKSGTSKFQFQLQFTSMASSICALSPSVPSHLTKTSLPLSQRNASISISLFFSLTSTTFRSSLFMSFEGSKCEMSRRTFAVKGIVASGVSVASSTLTAEAQPSSKG